MGGGLSMVLKLIIPPRFSFTFSRHTARCAAGGIKHFQGGPNSHRLLKIIRNQDNMKIKITVDIKNVLACSMSGKIVNFMRI